MGIGMRQLTREYGDTRIVFKSAEWKLYVHNGRTTFDTCPFYASAEFNGRKWFVYRDMALVAHALTREAALQTLEGLCALEGYS